MSLFKNILDRNGTPIINGDIMDICSNQTVYGIKTFTNNILVGGNINGVTVVGGDISGYLTTAAASSKYVSSSSLSASYAPLANPVFSGNPTATTQTAGDNTTKLATTAFVSTAVSNATMTTATTQAAGDNTTKLATTAFVSTAVGTLAPLASPLFSGNPKATTQTASDNGTNLATTAFVSTAVSSATNDTSLSRFAKLASPALTGNPTGTTPAAGDNTINLATTAFVTTAVSTATNDTSLSRFAKLASPALTGNPTATTQTAGDNSTKLATTAFVSTAVGTLAPLASPALTGNPTATTQTAGNNTQNLATTAFVTNAVGTLSTNTFNNLVTKLFTFGGNSVSSLFDFYGFQYNSTGLYPFRIVGSSLVIADAQTDPPGLLLPQNYGQNYGSGNLIVAGSIGIGMVPLCPLDVFPQSTLTADGYYFERNTSYSDSSNYNAQIYKGNTKSYIARFNGGIACAGAFISYSDKRVKNIVDESFNDIDLIQKLDVIRYRYTDHIHGTNMKIGFIAQDVKTVLPDAVSYDTTYIADVMRNIERVDGKILTLINHTICENDEIKIINYNNKDFYVTVSHVLSPDEFEIDTVIECDKLFLYGRKVNDLHMLDYDSIFALAFSGVKTLISKNNILENKVSQLEGFL